jgi:phosphoglycerate dehydrogenase-like enzyme
MKIWKNTSTLDGFDDGLIFTEYKKDADIALIGSKPIKLIELPKLKGIFRAGIGRDNVPEKEAEERGVVIRYPSKEIADIIFEETASFTCSLIFRMLYDNVGTLDPWVKEPRHQLSQKNLLVIGTGKIGSRIVQLMKPFMRVATFDILQNKVSELKPLIQNADCITIHIPKNDENLSFMDKEKLSWMKSGAVLINTARGAIVNEDAIYAEFKINRLRAAFDVYWQEPYTGKLKEFYPERFFMTPHVASTCKEFLIGCRKNLDQLISDIKSFS